MKRKERYASIGCSGYFVAFILIVGILYLIGYFVIFLAVVATVWFIIHKISEHCKTKEREKEQELNKSKDKPIKINPEAYARYCNAYLEHQDEMEAYEEHFHLNDK